MPCSRTRHRHGGAFLALLLVPVTLFAGGGPFNTLVVVNTNSVDSAELGEYYAAAHGIPAHHICRLGIATNLQTVTSNEFQTLLRGPIIQHIASENLVDQIDILVLCGAFPTRVRNVEGVTAALFYGFQNAPAYNEGGIGCNLPDNTFSDYYRAERAFRSADGWNETNGFIAFHLIASSLPAARQVVDRGAAAQSTFPAGAIYLYHYGDGFRGIREELFANTEFTCTGLPGLPIGCMIGPYYQSMTGRTNVIGYHDGYGTILPAIRTNNVWLTGTYADHMTSCAGLLPDSCDGQSTVLDWMNIGASASYGTVAEPCAYLEKFPDPLMGFYYARGFSLGECYAMSVAAPYQGLFAGDPLAAPFAAPPAIAVAWPPPEQIVTGSVPVQASAAAHSHGVPAARLDLYLDGRFLTNLATVGPTPGNRLSLIVAGRTNTVTVATNATLSDAVAALANTVSADSSQIVFANAFGDRLELIHRQFNHAGDHAAVTAGVSAGSADGLTLGVGLAATNLVPSIYPARKYVWLETHTASGANANDTLTGIVTLTNGVAVTNVIVAAQDEKVPALLDRFMNAINTNPELMATNGVRYDRLASGLNPFGALLARTPGPDGAGIQVDWILTPVSTNTGLKTNANFSAFCRDHPDDIRSRAAVLFHVRPTNDILSATAALDTTGLSDGFHTLDFVAYDGSAVAAQSRQTVNILVDNSSPQLAVLGTHGVGIADGEEPSTEKGTRWESVEEGVAVTNGLAIRNAGPVALAITNWNVTGSGAAAFQIHGVPAVVAAGAISNFAVVFSPATAGTYQASIRFDSDALVPQTNLLLEGTAIHPLFWLEISTDGPGVAIPPSSWQPAGTTVVLTATADPYYSFAGWSGDAAGTNNPFELWMDSPKSVQANFAPHLAAHNTPEWWLAQNGWTNDFDAAALADAEPDGYFTWQEYIADTDPKNSNSFPRVAFIAADGTEPHITWPASTGRLYQIHRADDLRDGPWITQELFLGTGAWIDTNPPPATNRYYRIAPQLP
jgi:uncharacterized protein (TIGR03790 family)